MKVSTLTAENEDQAQSAEGETEEAPEGESGTDAAKGEGDYYYDYVVKLYFVGYDGSVRPLDAYSPQPAPENTDNKLEYYSGSSINGLQLDRDGGLIAIESIYEGWFDGTEAELLPGERYLGHIVLAVV